MKSGASGLLGQEKDIARVIGLRIRQLRQARAWTQHDLAAHLDGLAKQSALSHYETGRSLPSMRTLISIAAAFEVHPASLLLDPREPADEAAMAALLSLVDPAR